MLLNLHSESAEKTDNYRDEKLAIGDDSIYAYKMRNGISIRKKPLITEELISRLYFKKIRSYKDL